ncbi:hypothetical protein AB6A40_004505 [Gnathostoma spinigerum]|uniref:Uncharacterized protein n=1 Tax=Gnathostoma spinigerum TaxID=75299 RepID=A0ABD6EDS6_9BILA
MHTLQLLLIHLIYIHRGHTLGCMVNICQSNPSNQLIRCSGDFCGGFKDKRYNGEIVEAVDISCSSGDIIQAPFDGQLYAWRPFGAREGYECADEGVTLEGSGQWQGM